MIDIPFFLLAFLFLVALVVSAFFSATEAAFLSVQRHKIRAMADRGVAGAQRVAKLAGHPEQFLPTILIGNNLANTAAATVGTLIAIEIFDSEGMGAIVAAVVVAVVLTVFGETIPKTLGTRRAEAAAMAFSTPLSWVEVVLLPVVFPLRSLNGWVSDRFGGARTSAAVAEEELKVLISLNRESGSLDETQASMLLRTLRLSDLQVRDVMTHRTDIVRVSENLPLSGFLEFNSRQYYTRFPVYKEGTDQVVGMLAARDVLRALGTPASSPSDPVSKLMQPARFYWESKPAIQAMTEMQRDGVSMGMVVDEFGAVVGLVTLHHLLEEMVGRGHDQRTMQALTAAEGDGYTLKGATRIHEVNDLMPLDLPEGDYDTVAGFIISRLGRVPKTGDKVTHGNWELTVTSTHGPRVEQVRLSRLRVPAQQPPSV